MKSMLAAVFEGEGQFTIKELPVPHVKEPDDVLIRVEACGICGSDLAIIAVPPRHPADPNTVLGHEYFGHVAEVGSGVTHVKPGDRVTVIPNLECGICAYCRLGMGNQCLNWRALGVHFNGGFAEYNLAPARAVLPISAELALAEAAFIEALSCVYASTSVIKIQPGEAAVVLGAGPIGLIFAKVFKASGAGTIIVSDIAPYRLEVAKAIGADVVVSPQEQDLEAIVRAETGLGAQVVVDAVGNLTDQATRIAAKKGRICMFGVKSDAKVEIEPWRVTHNELQLFGTFAGVNMFPHSIRVLESGALSLSDLLTDVIPLADIREGIERLNAGTAVKILVQP